MILLLEGLAGMSVLTFRPIAYTRNCRNSSGYCHRGGVLADQYGVGPCYVLWGKPQSTCPSDIHRRLLDQGARRVWARQSNETWRQGQLPSGQTEKVRSDYRVQSLHKGHGRHAFHRINNNDTQDEKVGAKTNVRTPCSCRAVALRS
jgi:hypothetical protein